MSDGDRYGFTYIKAELDDDGVLWVTLDRPERRNAISPEMHEELTPALPPHRRRPRGPRRRAHRRG